MGEQGGLADGREAVLFLDLSGVHCWASLGSVFTLFLFLHKATHPGPPSGLRITRKSKKSDSDFAFTELIAK